MSKRFKTIIIVSVVAGVVLTGLSFYVTREDVLNVSCYSSPVGAADLVLPSNNTITDKHRGWPLTYVVDTKLTDPSCQYGTSRDPIYVQGANLSVMSFFLDVIVWSSTSFAFLSVLRRAGKKK